jgi:hypothetical protein
MQPSSTTQGPLPLISPEEGTYETYSNVVDADWSLTDVTIRFMQIVYEQKNEGSTTQNRELAILEKASITIPWLTAKKGVLMLTDLIRSYEAVNGEIKDIVLAPHPAPPSPVTKSES